MHLPKKIVSWNTISFSEFMSCHSERRLYWQSDNLGIFKGLNYSAVMSRKRLEDILHFLMSSDENRALNSANSLMQ